MGPASARGTYSQSPAITAVARKATRPSRRSFGSRGGRDMVPPLGVSRALYAGPLGPGEPDDRNKWVMPATERPPLLGNLRAMPRVPWVLFAGTFVNRFGSFVITFLVLYLTDRGFSPRTGWPSTRGSRPGRSSPAPAPGGVGDQRARDHPRVDRGHSPASAGVPPAVGDARGRRRGVRRLADAGQRVVLHGGPRVLRRGRGPPRGRHDGLAVATTVDAGTAFATLSFTCSFLRPVQPDGRPLMAKARVAHRGRTIAMCTAEITDADGKRVAMASSSSMIVPTERWRRGEMVPPLDESPVRGDANAAPA